jgi:hypothetical protein
VRYPVNRLSEGMNCVTGGVEMDVEKSSQCAIARRQVISAGKASVHPMVRSVRTAKLSYQEAAVHDAITLAYG